MIKRRGMPCCRCVRHSETKQVGSVVMRGSYSTQAILNIRVIPCDTQKLNSNSLLVLLCWVEETTACCPMTFINRQPSGMLKHCETATTGLFKCPNITIVTDHAERSVLRLCKLCPQPEGNGPWFVLLRHQARRDQRKTPVCLQDVFRRDIKDISSNCRTNEPIILEVQQSRMYQHRTSCITRVKNTNSDHDENGSSPVGIYKRL